MTQKPNPNDKEKNESAFKPDPETLHTTDPQEHMEGPLSSLANKVGEEMENTDEDGEEGKEEKAG